MPDSDDELLGRACGGDEEALVELLLRYGPRARTALSGKIPRHWRSVLSEDDVMQVTYTNAFLHIGDFVPHGIGSFVAWLTRIADNNRRIAIKGLEAGKRPNPRKRLQSPSDGDSLVGLWEMLGGTTSTPSRQAARHEIHSALGSAIARLPERYQEVVRLYYIEELSAKEVSGRMRRSEGAVYMLLARARERLRDLLGSSSAFFSGSG